MNNGIKKFESVKEKANEIVYFNDGRMAPKNESKVYTLMKKVFIVFLIVLVLESLLFKEFLFADEPINVWLCFFITVGYLIKQGGYKRIESPSELQFYDEYMVFYVPKHYIKRGKERMEIQKIYYKDVTKCQFRTNTRKMVICGMMDEIYYKYDKNGNIEDAPSFQKHLDGMIKFYTVFDYEHDFKKIIERNTPLIVEYQDA